MSNRSRLLPLFLLTRIFTASALSAEPASQGDLSPDVITRTREITAEFKGEKGYVAQFGDSITYSMAFWSPMSWDDPAKYLGEDDALPKTPAKGKWKDTIKGARNKGAKFGNYSGWKVGNLLKSVDAVLARDKPESAIIMIGTNDINGGKVPKNYRAGLEEIVAKCLAAHCVPILNTIPPRRDHDQAVSGINTIIREIATTQKLPLVDFHAECLRLRPAKTWDGTLISKDGVHPSGGKNNLYDQANLKECGYALRNWINFRALRQLHFKVFEKRQATPNNR
ncbi:SGNH/GDSL hydrolase family protein [Verrucomicrobiaceae bacterium 227]